MIMRAYRKYIITMGLVWALALAAFVAVFFFLVSPQLGTLSRLARESKEKKKLYESAVSAATEENKKKLADEVATLKTRLADYAVELEESANLTFDVSRIAGQIQVAAFTVKTGEQSPAGDSARKYLQENRIEISFASDFRQFATLLNALERHRPVVFIDRLKLTRGNQDDKNHKVDMGLAYFAKKKQQG